MLPPEGGVVPVSPGILSGIIAKVPESIWNGKDPNPVDIVDISLAVDIARTLRLIDGGGGRSAFFFGGRERAGGTLAVCATSIRSGSLFGGGGLGGGVKGPAGGAGAGAATGLGDGGGEGEGAPNEGEGGALKLPPCVYIWPKGDLGGVLVGRLEIGEGGTKWNPSKIESALVEVELITEDIDCLLAKSSKALLC